ncbi:MAG TPA: hypothetical protein VM141_05910 [Planctomycetota bacterium]|nr:hypothetical protein [Planctomycetota bacterium]
MRSDPLSRSWHYLLVLVLSIMLLAALLLRHVRYNCGHAFWVIRGITDIGHGCPLLGGMNSLYMIGKAQVQYQLRNASYASDYDQLLPMGAELKWLAPNKYVNIRCHFGADHWIAVMYDNDGKMKAIAGDSTEPRLVE